MIGAPEQISAAGCGGRGAAYVYARTAGSWTLESKLSPPALGVSYLCARRATLVAISGSSIALFDPLDLNASSARQLAIYIYIRQAPGQWIQQAKLAIPEIFNGSDLYADFDFSLGLSGDNVVLGTPYATISGVSEQGAAYLFARSGNTWGLPLKLIANDGAAGDYFGQSLALADDTLAIGAWSKNQPGAGGTTQFAQGAVYVFGRTPQGAWTQRAQLTPTDGIENSRFGMRVALSGNTLIGSAPGSRIGSNDFQGALYAFVRNSSGQWSQQAKLVDSGGQAGDSLGQVFGGFVALDGDVAVVNRLRSGAVPAILTFARDGNGAWGPLPDLPTPLAGVPNASFKFGSSLALQGNDLWVSAPGANALVNAQQGVALRFELGGAGQYSLRQQLDSGDGRRYDRFGASVLTLGDINAIGAPGATVGLHQYQGKVFLYRRTGSGLTPDGVLQAADGAVFDEFGRELFGAGNWLFVGSKRGTYAYRRGTAGFEFRQLIVPAAATVNDNFATYGAFDGTTLVLGLPLGGTQYVVGRVVMFTLQAGDTFAEEGSLDGAAVQAQWFGRTVAVAGDTFVIGAPQTRTLDSAQNLVSYGAVFQYRRTAPGAYTLVNTWKSNALDGFFGASVDIESDFIAIGAPRAVTAGGSGSSGLFGPERAYVYVRNNAGQWSQQVAITSPPGGTGLDGFGDSVDLSGDLLAVSRNFSDGNRGGATALYVRGSGGIWSLVGDVPLPTIGNYRVEGYGAAIDLSGIEILTGAPTSTALGNYGAYGVGTAFLQDVNGLFADGFEN